MKSSYRYTTAIQKLSFRHPVIFAIVTHIIFWCTSYGVLGVIMYLHTQATQSLYQISNSGRIITLMLSATIMGLFSGTLLGLSDFYIFRQWSMGKSLGKLILVKAILYFFIIVILFSSIRFILWQRVLSPIYSPNGRDQINARSWYYYYGLVCLFTLFMSVVISFFIQINKKFGPGLLVPIILGKYVYPKIEERAFIFLDLKSSTTLAERLGHVKYSRLIRDCFHDINHVSVKYEAEIYQYVGDEIVLCWMVEKDADLTGCIDFYFDCQAGFNQRKEYYLENYNTIPEFKAGLHKGIVTGVEVGDVKRELAFHGDTLNVAARIQAKCNLYNADIIISETVFPLVKWNNNYQYQSIGTVDLKGRKDPVTIYSISLNSH